ncbi:ABC transporter ATP-binding protein [Infirmifilum sp. SLHALR2]|nr:MAG: hypothetical protein B7L53_06830 [Thermofilum sp. NZ13]
MSDRFLEAVDLYKYFTVRKGFPFRQASVIKAVDGVSLTVAKGEVLALVGESGSGKTTVARMVLGLLKPDRGRIMLEGVDVTSELGSRKYRSIVQGLFQNPASSLNPFMRNQELIAEPAVYLKGLDWSEAKERALKIAGDLGLDPDLLHRHPVEISGGEAQRVALARALTVEPKLLVLDEPTSALDVVVQAQIIKLLLDVKKRFNLSYLLITHDMGVARALADRVAVMYRGIVLEQAPADELFTNPLHPYTKLLIELVLEPDKPIEEKVINAYGDESSERSAAGCRFASRCPYRADVCTEREPELLPVGESHSVRCWLYGKS